MIDFGTKIIVFTAFLSTLLALALPLIFGFFAITALIEGDGLLFIIFGLMGYVLNVVLLTYNWEKGKRGDN